MQLDIFDDGADVMLRNDLADALLRDDPAAARVAAAALAGQADDDWALAPGALLAAILEQEPGGAFADLDDAASHRLVLESDVASAARRLLADRAGPWLARRFAQLAQRAAALPWSAAATEGHPASLWLAAGRWQEAAAAVERIASWRRIPVPLAWMAQAKRELLGLEAAWPLLAELAWLAPDRCAQVLAGWNDPRLEKLVARYEADIDGSFAWFPAWLLAEQPKLAEFLAPAQPGRQDTPERAFRVMVSLLQLEKQGRNADLMERRKELMGLHGPLFRCYMRRR
jgi:hypothetical protein